MTVTGVVLPGVAGRAVPATHSRVTANSSAAHADPMWVGARRTGSGEG